MIHLPGLFAWRICQEPWAMPHEKMHVIRDLNTASSRQRCSFRRLLERNETRAVGSSNTGATVLDRAAARISPCTAEHDFRMTYYEMENSAR